MAKAKRNARRDEKAARPKPAPRVPLEASPARNVVLRRVADLREHSRNVRTHPVAQLAVLDESFSDHGQVKPLVINPDNVLLAGHGSRDALLHLYGPDAEVACVIVAQDDTLQRKFMLRDNAGAELSGWDKGGLGIELADLRQLGIADLATLGFKPAELKRLLPAVGEREGFTNPDADAPPAHGGAAVSQPGDIWLLGSDCLTVSAVSPIGRCAVDASIEAWERFAKKSAILATTGETWAAVCAARSTPAVSQRAESETQAAA